MRYDLRGWGVREQLPIPLPSPSHIQELTLSHRAALQMPSMLHITHVCVVFYPPVTFDFVMLCCKLGTITKVVTLNMSAQNSNFTTFDF